MWFDLGFKAIQLSIKIYGPGRLYRDIYRVARMRTMNDNQRYHSLETVKYFLRHGEKIKPLDVINNKNIKFLARQCHQDLQSHPVISKMNQLIPK